MKSEGGATAANFSSTTTGHGGEAAQAGLVTPGAGLRGTQTGFAGQAGPAKSGAEPWPQTGSVKSETGSWRQTGSARPQAGLAKTGAEPRPQTGSVKPGRDFRRQTESATRTGSVKSGCVPAADRVCDTDGVRKVRERVPAADRVCDTDGVSKVRLCSGGRQSLRHGRGP